MSARTIKARDIQVGDELVGNGVVTHARVHFDRYKPPKANYSGGRRRPASTIAPPLKPVPIVEVRVKGREASVYLYPRQAVQVVRASVSETDGRDRGSILAPSAQEAA